MNPRIVNGCIHFLKKKGQLMSVKQPKGTDLHSHLMGTEEGHTHTEACMQILYVQNACILSHTLNTNKQIHTPMAEIKILPTQ